MDLMQAITENTEALRALSAQISTLFGQYAGDVRWQGNSPYLALTPESAMVEAAALSYEADVKPHVLNALKRDRAAVLGVLAIYRVERATEIVPAALPEFLAKIKAI
jgi:hypothetical protein